MKTFKEYINSNKNDSFCNMMSLIWERYNPEIRDFLSQISLKDAEIKKILEDLESPEETDVVAKNASDSNFGDGEV